MFRFNWNRLSFIKSLHSLCLEMFRINGNINIENLEIVQGQKFKLSVGPRKSLSFIQYLKPLTAQNPYFSVQIKSISMDAFLLWMISKPLKICLNRREWMCDNRIGRLGNQRDSVAGLVEQHDRLREHNRKVLELASGQCEHERRTCCPRWHIRHLCFSFRHSTVHCGLGSQRPTSGDQISFRKRFVQVLAHDHFRMWSRWSRSPLATLDFSYSETLWCNFTSIRTKINSKLWITRTCCNFKRIRMWLGFGRVRNTAHLPMTNMKMCWRTKMYRCRALWRWANNFRNTNAFKWKCRQMDKVPQSESLRAVLWNRRPLVLC